MLPDSTKNLAINVRFRATFCHTHPQQKAPGYSPSDHREVGH
jgi:hypothetical protein